MSGRRKKWKFACVIVSALLIGLTGTAAAGNDKVEVPADLKPIFEEKADEYGIDEYFLEALAWRESRFKTTASNGNCKGLMEVNVKYYPHDWKDPEQNIDAACRCIIAIINQYDAEDLGDIASYYHGEGKPGYSSYVQDVDRVQRVLAEEDGGQ